MTFLEPFLQSGSLFSVEKDAVLIGWGTRTWSPNPPPKGTPSFYFPDFFLKNESPWCSHEFWDILKLDFLIETLKKSPIPPFSMPKWNPSCKISFRKNFHALKEQLYEGKLQKGVPYIFETTDTSMNPALLQHALLSLLNNLKLQPLYGYGFWEPDFGMLGGTPELLFKSCCPKNSLITTMACAGTEKTGEAICLKSPKERHEHHVVIQGIEESISYLGGILQIHKTKVLKLSLLNHLLTPLTVTFPREVSFESIVRALHPTPALGAFPRPEGMRWLDHQEKNLPRKRFGAPVAMIGADGCQTVCAVAIRNVQWNNQITIGAGVGIVKESDFEREWDELHLKIKSTKKILSL